MIGPLAWIQAYHPEGIDMLSQFFEAASRIRAILSGPSGALIEGFSKQLLEPGYSEISARHHIRSAEHLVPWASRRGLSTQEFDEQVLQRYGGHLRRCSCGRFSSANRADVLAGARFL